MKILKPSSTTIFLATLVVLMALPCRADAPGREDQLKAAFVYNFTQFVEWPAGTFKSDDAPFVVGVVGPGPVSDALVQIMESKAVANHPIVVTTFANADAIGPCQLLFVPAAQDSTMPAILAKIGRLPVLTVGEGDGFLPAGGALRLFLDDSKMRFRLSPAAMDGAGLKASAKLMKLARIYRK